MMGERRVMQEALFYGFSLERHVPDNHMLRKIDRFVDLSDLRVRADPHAQYEIRAYAERLLHILKAWVPLTFEAFQDYRLNAVNLSAAAVEVLRRRLRGEHVPFEDSGLSKREWDELLTAFDLPS